MYGLVNRAVEGLLRKEHGDEVWSQIKRRAGVTVSHFGRMEIYDDEVTYGLVGAASEVLGVSADLLLEAFGRHWVLYVAEEGYGSMLSAAGDDLRSFLEQLDSMHARVNLGHPEMRSPSFELEMEGEVMVLHYRSTREGLGAMVLGLLDGMARRFGETIEVEWIRPEGELDHDVFRIHRA